VDAAMRRDCRNDRGGDSIELVNHLGVAEVKHSETPCGERRIAPSIARGHLRVVKLVAVRLYDDPVLHQQVDSSHSGKSGLTSDPEPQIQDEHPNDRLKARLGKPTSEIQKSCTRAGQCDAQDGQLLKRNHPKVQSAVDSRDRASTFETPQGITNGLDR
jgi:hypothetical protein